MVPARIGAVRVGLVIETKHPNPRGLEVERRVAAMLAEFGWDRPGSGVRLISFSEARWKRSACCCRSWSAPS